MSFMGFKPVENLKSCIRSRPPLVLFSLCLASISLVTTSFAIYFKFHGNVKNPDELSLNDLGRRLNRLGFCPTLSELSSSIRVDPALLNRTVSYEASSPVPLLPNTTYWTRLSAGDLGFDGSQNISLHLSLDEASGSHVCVTYFYPTAIKFPETKGAHRCSAAADVSATSVVHLQKMDNVLEPSSAHCNETDGLRLALEENEEWNVMLTEEDREIIYIHLLATSGLLTLVFVAIVCFALLRGGLPSGGISTRKLDDDFDRVPLTS